MYKSNNMQASHHNVYYLWYSTPNLGTETGHRIPEHRTRAPNPSTQSGHWTRAPKLGTEPFVMSLYLVFSYTCVVMYLLIWFFVSLSKPPGHFLWAIDVHERISVGKKKTEPHPPPAVLLIILWWHGGNGQVSSSSQGQRTGTVRGEGSGLVSCVGL